MLSFYSNTTNYFQKEFGFRPFRSQPNDIRIQEMAFEKDESAKLSVEFDKISRWQSENDMAPILTINLPPIPSHNPRMMGRVIAVLEALLSFLPKDVRSHPIIHAMSLYRLGSGSSPLNKLEMKNAQLLFNKIKPSYERKVANDEKLKNWLSALPNILPKGRTEEMLMNYYYVIANCEQFLKGDSINPFIQALLEDISLKSAMIIELDEFETFLMYHLDVCFSEHMYPVSPELFLDYLHRIAPDTDMRYRKRIFDLNLDDLVKLYSRMADKSLSFSYYIDYNPIGFHFVYYLVEFNPIIKREIVDLCFSHPFNVFTTYTGLSSESCIQIGIIHSSDDDGNDIDEFFKSLQIQGIVQNYIIIPYKMIGNMYNVCEHDRIWKFHRIIMNKGVRNKGSIFGRDFNHIIQKEIRLELDTVEFTLFRFLNYIGNSGVWMNYKREDLTRKFRKELESSLVFLKTEFDKVKRLEKEMEKPPSEQVIQLMKIIFNLDFPRDDIFSFQSMIKKLTAVYGKAGVIIILKEMVKHGRNISENKLKDLFRLIGSNYNKKILENKFKDLLQLFSAKGNEEEERKKLLEKSLQDVIDFLNLQTRVSNVSLGANIWFLENYLRLPDSKIKKDLYALIKLYLNLKIIRPNFGNSILLPITSFLAIAIIRNVGEGDPRLTYVVQKIPHGYYIRCAKPPYWTLIYCQIDPRMSPLMKKILEETFGNSVIYFGHFAGYIFTPSYNRELKYDIMSGGVINTTETMQELREILSTYKHSFGNVESKKDSGQIPANQIINPSTIFRESYIQSKIQAWWDQQNYSRKRTIPPITQKELLAVVTEFQAFCENSLAISSPSKKIFYTLEPNTSRFGFTHYIVCAELTRNTLELDGGKQVTAQELMPVPGCIKIEVLPEISTTTKCVLHYLFPQGDYCRNMFAYMQHRNLLSRIKIFAVYKKRISFLPNYFTDTKGWNIGYARFRFIAHKIITTTDYRIPPAFFTIDYLDAGGVRYDGDSIEYNMLVATYGKYLQNLLVLNQYRDPLINMIHNRAFFPHPEFNLKELNLTHRTTLIINSIDENAYQKLMMIMSLLPHVIIYELARVDKTPDKIDNPATPINLFIDIFTPPESVDNLTANLQLIFKDLEIETYVVYQELIETNPQEFTGGAVKTLENPYAAHDWDRKTKVWRRLAYFDKKGMLRKRSDLKKGEYAKRYLKEGGIPHMLQVLLTNPDGIEASGFKTADFSITMKKIFRNLEFLEGEGLLVKEGEVYKLNRLGMTTANKILKEERRNEGIFTKG